jgi:SagB-type dehydrogenase family enzyme
LKALQIDSKPDQTMNVGSARGWREAMEYHERTKHHFNRYARSLGYMDWKNQPDPFRRFAGAPIVPLRLARADPEVRYDELFTRTSGTSAPDAVSLASISLLLELSLAVSAWKEFRGSRWALRINPSSGNLHPTEGYLLIGPTVGLCEAPTLFHYAANDHVLEQRALIAPEVWQGFTGDLPPGTFFIGFASVHWREAWKYGERAYRYCQHDAGHAVAAVALSAAVQGWRTRMLNDLGDADLEKLLGLDVAEDFADAEREHPDCLLRIYSSPDDAGKRSTLAGEVGGRDNSKTHQSSGPASGKPEAISPNSRFAQEGLSGTNVWYGRPNRLSAEHVRWEVIDEAAAACRKPSSHTMMDKNGIPHSNCAQVEEDEGVFGPPLSAPPGRELAAKIIRQRRSALDFDGKTPISAGVFYLMMDRVLPRWDQPPWAALGPPVCVHLGLFVHLVTGLEPGLYCLVRNLRDKENLEQAMHSSFTWEKPEGSPSHLPLFRLLSGDARRAAEQLSCGQAIAGDSAFSLGMIARFEQPIREQGGWFYRRLHWEAGMIGQVLYLEAEAAGVRATGIGCFFDDPVHELFGLRGRDYQTIYHFTVGKQVEDLRLMTWPPYTQDAYARGR